VKYVPVATAYLFFLISILTLIHGDMTLAAIWVVGTGVMGAVSQALLTLDGIRERLEVADGNHSK
jgi:hypothetical protein